MTMGEGQLSDKKSGGTKTRKLFIAWSLVWGFVFVLMIAMWSRSLSLKDDWRRCEGHVLLNIQSYRGELGIGRWPYSKPIPWRRFIERFDEPAERLWPPMKDQAPLSYIGVRWQTLPPLQLFAVRYWC